MQVTVFNSTGDSNEDIDDLDIEINEDFIKWDSIVDY
jgi:hypothetical protein